MALAVKSGALLCAIALTQPVWACGQKVYLTLDTGNMAQAERIAGILDKHAVKATFFLANERTLEGGWSLDDRWAPFWKRLRDQGHAFGNHTYDHVYFRGIGPQGEIKAKPQFGALAGRLVQWDQTALCSELARVAQRFQAMTGSTLDPVWRAPGGKAPAQVMQMAKQCGYAHVHWASAGFLGDELPSETHPNAALLAQSLRTIQAGDILMAHLGIWSRKEAYAPMLDPLIEGLKAKGYCFATLREHPDYAAAFRQAPVARPAARGS